MGLPLVIKLKSLIGCPLNQPGIETSCISALAKWCDAIPANAKAEAMKCLCEIS
jgi:hypothetical protein